MGVKRQAHFGTTCLILGAGASRAVSYANERPSPSPLDTDFFDILSQKQPKGDELKNAVRVIREHYLSFPPTERLWQSMERAFYTMHLNQTVYAKIYGKSEVEVEFFLENFARCVAYLLREAHGSRICEHHKKIISQLSGDDCVITFNYDLVVERVFAGLFGNRVDFGRWIYGGCGDVRPKFAVRNIPALFKLHGSSNWKLKDDEFVVRQKAWANFAEKPGYRAYEASETSSFPIQLPYWDKQIEGPPWNLIWRGAAAKLLAARNIVVWGYSMPFTDVKSREFFRIAFDEIEGFQPRLCVIDPSDDTAERWRGMSSSCRFWRFRSFEEFDNKWPDWLTKQHTSS